jgi:glycosyltransferase involved in cell wall biosynthesis
MKVLLLSRFGRLGSSSRLRSYQYLPSLEVAGIEVTVAPLLRDAYLENLYAARGRLSAEVVLDHLKRVGWLMRSSGFDLVWIEAELFPWLPAWGELLLKRSGVPYLVDYDDAVFHRYDLHRSPLVRRLLGAKIDRIMGGAALVVAGNDYIAERARLAGARRVELLPTVIDLERYPLAPVQSGGGFTVGWIGSPSTAKYLRWLQPALSEICRGDAARLVAVGSGSLELEGVATELRPWSEASEAADIAGFHAGIMPLPDQELERGKCGYKLIQYMACGRPVVASPVGINRELVEHGKNGFLADSPAEWVSCLRMLGRDPELRARLGQAGRKKVEEKYCLQVTAPQLVSLLRSAAAGGC